MLLSKSFGLKGIHPDDNKHSTNRKAIENADVPNTAYIPISQHIGKPATIIVKPGEIVEEGQILAIGDGFVSSNVHASIPGTVKGIEEIYIGNGKKTQAVVIELGGEFIKSGRIIQLNDWKSMRKEALLQKIQEAGIVGLGGATFPLHVKLTIPPDKKLDTLIINGAECEPYLSCDHRLLLEKTEGFLQGIAIINKILDVPNIYIGIENNKRDAIKRLKILCSNRYPYKIIPLKVKYPQGDEKQLIKAITGRIVPIGKLPVDLEVIVINVSSTIAVKEAIINDKPLIERVVTVAGNGIREPKNLIVKIGTPIRDIIEECGGLTDNINKIVIGGPMMGFAQKDLNTPVTKNTSGILCLTNEEGSKFKKETICINCGKCIFACSFGLMPTLLSKYVEFKSYDKAYEAGILTCKECGACAWICPAKIPLVQHLKFGKNMVNKLILKEGNQKK